MLGRGNVCSWSSTGFSYEELQPTKVTAPGGQVQSEGLGKAWTQGRLCVWKHQTREQSHTSTFGRRAGPTAPSHGDIWAGQCLLSLRRRWHPVSCPTDHSWTCWYLRCQHGPGSETSKASAAAQGPSEGPSTRS